MTSGSCGLRTLVRLTIRAGVLVAFSLVSTTAIGQEETVTSAADPATPLLVRGITVHPVNGDTIENGAVLVVDGKIKSVGPVNDLDAPDDADILDMNAQPTSPKTKRSNDSETTYHLYPGLIDADTAIGLIEIESVRATRDTAETGELNPNAKALTAFNPDSELIPVARADGVLLALSVPRGRLLNGQSALMMLDGWTGEDMALKPAVAMHLKWPVPFRRRTWDDDESAEERLKRSEQRVEKLTQLFDQAELYRTSRATKSGDSEQAEYDARLESLVPVVAGELPLFVHADDVRQIEQAIAFAVERKLRLVIVGGYEAESCAQLLKQHDIPVIVTGTHRLPRNRHAAYDEPYTLPARLQAAGVNYCLSGYDRFSASAVRNLPQHAGTAAAYGLSSEEAVRAITLSSANILGAGDRVGSIEVGKDATFIITTGDVLEITSNVTHAFIQGRPVDLDNRHKRLYRKYKEKYRK